MPILKCPECGDEFSYLQNRTTADCPKEECEGERSQSMTQVILRIEHPVPDLREA